MTKFRREKLHSMVKYNNLTRYCISTQCIPGRDMAKRCHTKYCVKSPVSSPLASPRVEASDTPKQVQHLSTCITVLMETPEPIKAPLIKGEWVSSMDLSDPPPRSPSTKLKEVPDTVLRVDINLWAMITT